MTRNDINLISEAYRGNNRRSRPQNIGYILIEEAQGGSIRAGSSNDAGDMVGEIFFTKPGQPLKLQADPIRGDGIRLSKNVRDDSNTLLISAIDPRLGFFSAKIGELYCESNNKYIHIRVDEGPNGPQYTHI